MKEEKKLDILENAGQSVIDRLSSEFPPQDENEKELIFKMSERKFNKNINGLCDSNEQTVSGVEVYKRPIWQRVLSAAAAIAVLAGGAVGIGYTLSHFRNVSDTASNAEAEDTTRHDQKKLAPFGDFAEFGYNLIKPTPPKDFIASEDVFIEENADWITYFPLYETKDITTEQREKIAELLNNYDYDEEESFYLRDRPLGIIRKYIGEGVPNEFAGTITEEQVREYSSFTFIDDFNFSEDTPYFFYRGDDEVKLIGFEKIGGADPHGILIYTHLHFTDQEGKLVMTDEKIFCNAWRTDYNYFISSIKDILGDIHSETEEVNAEESMTETETSAEPDNVSFLTLCPSFKDQNWVFSDINAQQTIETSPEQRENIYNIINSSKCSIASKTDFESHNMASEAPKEHISLSSRDEENLYIFNFSLINGKIYAAIGKYDTEKADHTDEAYLISDDTDMIQRIKDCMN